MKVLHAVHCYAPAIGGVETVIGTVSEMLVGVHGDEVTVSTTNCLSAEGFVHPDRTVIPAGETIENGVVVRRHKVARRQAPLLRRGQAAAWRLRIPGNQYLRVAWQGPWSRGMTRDLLRTNADVVVAASFPLLHMFVAAVAKRRSGRPLVFHGALHPLDAWGYDRPMIVRAIKRCDAYIAYTGWEREFVISAGVDPSKIHVVGLGVDVARFATADGRAFRDDYGLGDAPIVTFIGQQSGTKGIDTLVEAMKRVWSDVLEARLVLAGARTAFTPRLIEMIGALPSAFRDQVILIHDFREEEKAGIMAACDVFAYPSRYESFGLAYLEAWAASKPVIGARSGAVASVIAEGKDGLLVEPGNSEELAQAILTLLTDPARRADLGATGHAKVVRSHTWEQVTGAVRRVYATAAR